MPSRIVKKNRSKIKLNWSKPVVLVYRSNKNILAQVLEPETKKCLFTANSYGVKIGTKIEKSTQVGKQVAEFLKSKGYTQANFYRNGFLYHGRIAEVAESIRKSGIEM